jgi:hypothetical protein
LNAGGDDATHVLDALSQANVCPAVPPALSNLFAT